MQKQSCTFKKKNNTIVFTPPFISQFIETQKPSRSHTLTCADHHSLDQLSCVEAGLDDVGPTEQCVSLMLLCVVGTVSLLSSVSWHWVWEVCLCHWNTFA